MLDAQVDLNPHQVEAALFAFKSPLSKGAILADEVGRFTAATRRPWMDLENTAAIFAAAAKKAHSVAATAESIQSVDFGSGVELGRVLINPQRTLGASSPSSPAQSGTIMSGVR